MEQKDGFKKPVNPWKHNSFLQHEKVKWSLALENEWMLNSFCPHSIEEQRASPIVSIQGSRTTSSPGQKLATVWPPKPCDSARSSSSWFVFFFLYKKKSEEESHHQHQHRALPFLHAHHSAISSERKKQCKQDNWRVLGYMQSLIKVMTTAHVSGTFLLHANTLPTMTLIFTALIMLSILGSIQMPCYPQENCSELELLCRRTLSILAQQRILSC